MNPNPADQLWTHQSVSLDQARSAFGYQSRCVMIQLPTGTGKTKMVVSGINGAISKPSPVDNSRCQSVAFVVPRRELLWQSGAELKEWGIKHKIVTGTDQPNLFDVHIWCTNTFIKRVRNWVKQQAGEQFSGDALQQWPDLIIPDEAHLNLKMWLEIKAAAPDHVKFLGVTATPERLDRGDLSKMWDVLIEGDQLAWFVDNGFLKRPWVLSVPPMDRLEGLDALKRNAAGDVSAAQLAELYKARAKGGSVMYGNEIEHYKLHGQNRSYLIFCRSLEQTKEVAAEFTAAGFKTEDIDGKMSDPKRKEKIEKVKSGAIMGLTTVDLCTYGLDVPKISCLIMLRPTESVALFFQMIGRGLRWDGIWPNCLILDHVGNCDLKKHGHPLEPRAWNWTGAKKKEPVPEGAIERVSAVQKCPVCYDILIRGKNPDGDPAWVCRTPGCPGIKEVKARKDLKQVGGYLIEIQPGEPLDMGARLPENQRVMQDRINSAVTRYRSDWYPGDGPGGVINAEAVADLIAVAYELKWKNAPVAVYKKLVPHQDMTVNTPLLVAIAQIKEYDHRWIDRQREFFELGLSSRTARMERTA